MGVTGGIAAYKTPFLVRLLVKAGAQVKVILTPSAKDFVSPLTLAALSKNPSVISFSKEEGHTVDWNNHVALGLWADLMIIAPATANTLSKMASGICDNLFLAVYLSAKCPVFFAPAMDLDMYHHGTVQANFERLKTLGNIMIPAGTGELASGLYGEGRMAEPEEITAFIEDYYACRLPMSGLRVLITAGPTQEAIDPVRFIGNRSSGLMGYELAQRAADLGAKVTLVSGPTHLDSPKGTVEMVPVVSAEEMYRAAMEHFAVADVVIAAAAVADYRPVEVAGSKIKKKEGTLTLDLVPNKDILMEMGMTKTKQYLVGFALETDDEVANALEKLRRKRLDAIVLNSLKDKGAGFGTPTNKITFLDKNSTIIPFELKTKADVAADILDEIIARIRT